MWEWWVGCGLYIGMVSCLLKIRFVDPHCPHLVNCSHAFWAQQTAIYNCLQLRRNEVEEGVRQKQMPIFWQGTPYYLISWLLCDIAIDVRCVVSCNVKLQNLSHLYNACELLHSGHLTVTVETNVLVLRRSFVCLSPLLSADLMPA